MKRILIVSFFAISCSLSLKAQRLHNLYGVSWEVSFPTDNNFLDKVSYSGGRFEYRHFLKGGNASIGGAVSWNNFSQYVDRRTYENDQGTQAITTDTYRAIFNLPITVNGHYYFQTGGAFTPYAGLGLGTLYSDQEVYYNIFVSDESNWGFVARPEIGTLINPTGGNWRIMLAAGYNYGTNKNNAFKINGLSNYWLSLGIAIVN